MRRATGNEMAKYVIRLAMVIPTSHVKARYAQLQIIIHRLWNVLKRVEEWGKVGKRIILVLR